MRHPGQVLTRDQIVDRAWDFEAEHASNVVDVFMRNLRRKIDDPHEHKLLHTVRGAGYTLRELDEPPPSSTAGAGGVGGAIVTVRVRLTLWYIVVVCVGFAVFAGVTVWQAQQAASAALDQQLHHRAQEVATYLRVDHGIVVAPGAADESGSKPGESTFWIRVLTPRGRVVSSLGPSLAPLPSGLLGDLRTGVHDSGRVRSFVLPIVRHGRTAAIIQMITTTDQVDAARRQLVTAMAIAGVILVLLAGLAGLFLANRALQPVDRITRIAGEIGESDLSRRVSEEIWRDGRRGQRHDDELGRLAHTF